MSGTYLNCSDTVGTTSSLSPSHTSSTMAPADSARIQEAKILVKTDPRKAESQYRELISKAPSANSDSAIREYETALVSLGELYRDEK